MIVHVPFFWRVQLLSSHSLNNCLRFSKNLQQNTGIELLKTPHITDKFRRIGKVLILERLISKCTSFHIVEPINYVYLTLVLVRTIWKLSL